MKASRGLTISKFSLDVLERRVFPLVETDDPDVILGAAFGEDVALTRVGGDVLISHVDPIIGAIGNIGWLVHGMVPLGQLLGLSGEMLTALLFALLAKEIVMPALAMTYGLQTTLVESDQVLNYLYQVWTPLISYTFLVFFMFYLPCLVTVWATWKETLNVRWTLTSLLISLLMASVITVLVYKGGRLLGFS